MLNDIVKNLLKEVSGIAEIPANAAFNIRNNSKSEGRHSTENIDIVPKEGGSGLDIYVKPFTKNENVHIPALITQDGVSEVVYNSTSVRVRKLKLSPAAASITAAVMILSMKGFTVSSLAKIPRLFISKSTSVRGTAAANASLTPRHM